MTCKNDPNCSFIVPLASSWCVEDSIDTLNSNFSALDAETCNLTFSAIKMDPMVTWFESNSSLLLDMMTFVNDMSAKIEGAATTVNTLSSFWLTPITIIYKNILDAFSMETVRSWVNANFPQKTGNCVNYLNGQKMYVYSLKYAHLDRGGVINVTTPAYTYPFVSVTKPIGPKLIIKKTIMVTVPEKTTSTTTVCKDQYVGEIAGYELCMADGTWIYVRTLPA